MSRFAVVAVLACLGLTPAFPALAECPTYTVRSGDTLRIIAERFYGRRDASTRIYRANAAKIGENPNLIEVGQLLTIPCDDDAAKPQEAQQVRAAPAVPKALVPKPAPAPVAASSAGVVKPMVAKSEGEAASMVEGATNLAVHSNAADKPAMAPEKPMANIGMADKDMAEVAPGGMEMSDGKPMEDHADKDGMMQPDAEMAELQATAMADTPLEALPRLEMTKSMAPLHLLTGGPFAPFVSDGLPQGGMITELVRTALEAAGAPASEVVFVNDRAAHLDGVMPRGGFALTFPWMFPDCRNDAQTTDQRNLCDRYRASEGFYEFVTEFYARADLQWANVLVPAAMVGARICRPVGYPVDDLLSLDLLPDKVELIRGRDAIDCLMMVDRAEADLASMDAAVTRALIDQISVENPILVIEPLTHVAKMRVLALRDDPASAATIEMLNTGLRIMADDGRWFEIVSRHLTSQGS